MSVLERSQSGNISKHFFTHLPHLPSGQMESHIYRFILILKISDLSKDAFLKYSIK